MKRWAIHRIAILAYHPARHAATLAILVMSLPWPRRIRRTGRTSNWPRPMYEANPACQCVACVNGGDIPFPGAAETLGYAMPHIPPNTRAPWAP
jgi:hypothetical protein